MVERSPTCGNIKMGARQFVGVGLVHHAHDFISWNLKPSPPPSLKCGTSMCLSSSKSLAQRRAGNFRAGPSPTSFRLRNDLVRLENLPSQKIQSSARPENNLSV